MFAGPLLGAAMVAFAFLANAGPGFFFFSMASAISFSVFTPLVQVALRHTSRYADRPGIACAMALCLVATGLVAGSSMNVFNQW